MVGGSHWAGPVSRRPRGEMAETLREERSGACDLIRPSEPALPHVLIERLDELGPGPCREIQVAGLQCVAELSHDVVPIACSKAGRSRCKPTGEPLSVQRPWCSALSVLLFGGLISPRGAMRLAWSLRTHRTRPRNPPGTG